MTDRLRITDTCLTHGFYVPTGRLRFGSSHYQAAIDMPQRLQGTSSMIFLKYLKSIPTPYQ